MLTPDLYATRLSQVKMRPQSLSFHLHNSTQVFTRQRFFLEQRMRKYCRSGGSLKAME